MIATSSKIQDIKNQVRIACLIATTAVFLFPGIQVRAQEPATVLTAEAVGIDAKWKCEIPELQQQIDKIIARYQFAQKMEKNATDFLGVKNAENLREQMKVNVDNPFGMIADIGVKATVVAASFIAAPASGSVAALTALDYAFVGGLSVAGGAVLTGFEQDERNRKPRKEVLDQRLVVTRGDASSDSYKKVKDRLESIAEDERPGIISLNKFLDLQNKSLARFDRMHLEIEDMLKNQTESIGWPYQTNRYNRSVADLKKQAATANLILYTAERKITGQVRQNLNIICAQMMKNGQSGEGIVERKPSFGPTPARPLNPPPNPTPPFPRPTPAYPNPNGIQRNR